MTPILETQRFSLREFDQNDLDDLAAMVADEDQMRFYPRPKTRDEASAWISRNLSLYEEYGFGFWFIESLPTSGFLGYCGIMAEEEEPPITREDVNAIMPALMSLGATMDEIRELLLEDNGEDEEEPGS